MLASMVFAMRWQNMLVYFLSHCKISYSETEVRLESKMKNLIDGKFILNVILPICGLSPYTEILTTCVDKLCLKRSAICISPFSAALHFLVALVPKSKGVQRNISPKAFREISRFSYVVYVILQTF